MIDVVWSRTMMDLFFFGWITMVVWYLFLVGLSLS